MAMKLRLIATSRTSRTTYTNNQISPPRSHKHCGPQPNAWRAPRASISLSSNWAGKSAAAIVDHGPIRKLYPDYANLQSHRHDQSHNGRQRVSYSRSTITHGYAFAQAA